MIIEFIFVSIDYVSKKWFERCGLCEVGVYVHLGSRQNLVTSYLLRFSYVLLYIYIN